ncbi:hypothetical protein FOCC_FOCC012642 [Frankliniella occidentalis]|nr:hypothetical protein FOCC_FOCC012642 [Frankliniella occidentalis]
MNDRAQVDLIDFRSHPDGEYKHIMTYQDHWTKKVQEPTESPSKSSSSETKKRQSIVFRGSMPPNPSSSWKKKPFVIKEELPVLLPGQMNTLAACCTFYS